MTNAKALDGNNRRHRRWLRRLVLGWKWIEKNHPQTAQRIKRKVAKEIPDPRLGNLQEVS